MMRLMDKRPPSLFPLRLKNGKNRTKLAELPKLENWAAITETLSSASRKPNSSMVNQRFIRILTFTKPRNAPR